MKQHLCTLRGSVRPTATLLTAALMTALPASLFAWAPATAQVSVDSPRIFAIQQSRRLGPAPSTQMVNIGIALQMRDMAGLEANADAVSDPNSPLYHAFLTPEQIADQFGATPQARIAVKDYLTSKGFKITLDSRNGSAILATGTVAQAQAAFGTTINTYSGPDPLGRTITYYANTSSPTLPAAIAGYVMDVEGLQNYRRPEHRVNTTLLKPVTTRGCYGLATGYAAGFTGTGAKVGVTNFVGYRLSNTSLYYSSFGLPTPGGGINSNIHEIQVNTGVSTGTENAEGDLDYQMEAGMVPLGDIYIYSSASDLFAILSREASDNICDVISESYGWSIDPGWEGPYHTQHVIMTNQGITYCAASGDTGTAGVNGTYCYPDFEQEVLQVGGTIASVDTVTGARASETTWNGGGGGWKNIVGGQNTRPSWQAGLGVPTTPNFRYVPDIAMHSAGSGTGAYSMVYQGSVNNGYIGTSFASPIFAGALANILTRLTAAGAPLFSGQTRVRYGRIQNLFYTMNATSLKTSVFLDITSGNNGTLPSAAQYGNLGAPTTASNAVPRWDFATGWGAPNFEGLYQSAFIKGTVAFGEWGGSLAQPVTIEVRNAGGTVLQTVATTLSAGGAFAFIPNNSVPDGTYTITCKGSHWLRQGLTSTAVARANLPQTLSFSLVNGDADGDNVVGPLDLNVLRTNFGGSLPAADLDGDGVVGPLDLNIERNHFGASGY